MYDEREDAVTGPAETDEAVDAEKLDRSGAFGYDSLLDERLESPPDEFTNPSGIGRGDCDTPAGADDESCAIEITAHVDDLFMEETKPGFGIAGYEGEEDGGG